MPLDPIWLDFVEDVSGRADGSWIFRGEGDRGWELRPKVGRPDVCGPAGYRPADERTLFDNFRREAPRYEDGVGFTLMDWLAVAQHHGLPTRLMDWTTNPLTAAWFAVANEANATNGRIHMIQLAHRGAITDPFSVTDSPTFTQVPALAARITAQQGLFSVHPDPTSAWQPGGAGIMYETFDIPATSKREFRHALHLLGFNSSRLMSDLDSLSKTLQWEYGNRV